MPKRRPRQNDLTDAFHDGELAGQVDDELGGDRQKWGQRSKHQDRIKTERTAAMRRDDAVLAAEKKKLPAGQVIQVHSLYSEVRGDDNVLLLCTARKTLRKTFETALVVGDRVRYATTGGTVKVPGSSSDEPLLPEGVIEVILDRRTLLTRTEALDDSKQDPIVANADQMLIVVSLLNPWPRWGLVDRMIIAAQGGGLEPIIVLNKVDLDEDGALGEADEVLRHYATLGVASVQASASTGVGLDHLRQRLAGKETVLAGHSGVGKSSLVNALEPGLDLKTSHVSDAHDKGRHTTTSARRYPLNTVADAAVIDTPGVKVFGLWGVRPDELLPKFYPDVAADTAPEWRRDTYERIKASIEPEYG
jgi:ribosome biogenesis GTPase